MKTLYKGILSLILLAAISFGEKAQAQAFWGVYGGINTAGLNLGDWKTSTDPSDKEPGFEKIRRLTFGVNVELPFSDYFILQPELALSMKGGIVNIDSGYSDITGGGSVQYQTVNNLDLWYLSLPILAKTRLQLTNPRPLYPNEGTGKPLFVEFYAGPVFNYLLNPKADYTQTVREQNALTNVDTAYKFSGSGKQAGLKAIDISASLGATFKWKWGKKSYIWLDARYTLNFMDINKGQEFIYNIWTDAENNAQGYSVPSVKNASNLSITLGINTTFTKRRYWDHPRQIKRKF